MSKLARFNPIGVLVYGLVHAENAGDEDEENRIPLIFYHGTDRASALALLAGAPLSVDKATRMNIHGAPGFYLATDQYTAELFSMYRRNNQVIRYLINRQAYGALLESGAVLRDVPQGKLFQPPPGKEFYVPPSAFPMFNTLLRQGQITPTPLLGN